MPPDKNTTDRELLQAVKLHPDPVVTVQEVSELVALSAPSVHRRLQELGKQGLINRKKPGSRSVVYWLSESGKQAACEQR